LRDIAESDLCESVPDEAAERLPKDPKPPEDGFDARDADEDDDVDDEDDERCDENPLLKDEEPDGLASAGACASGRIRDSANATRAYFEIIFNMVR
jgi:hypothetical protein